MFLYDEPQSMGVHCMAMVPLRMAAIISASVMEAGSSKYFSIRASS